MPRYTVYARVGVNLDTDKVIRLGSISLGRLPIGVQVMLPPRRLRVQNPLPTVVLRGQEVDVETPIFYWVDRSAATLDAAIETVRRDDDPIVRAVLTEAMGFQVTTDVVSATNHELKRAEGLSAVTQVRYLGATPPDVNRMVGFANSLLGDQKLRSACRHLAVAQLLAELAPSAPEVAVEAALLEYAKCLEILARDRRIRSATSDETAHHQQAQREELLVKLDCALRSASLEDRVTAVRATARELGKMVQPPLREAVQQMADALQLSSEWTEAALQLIDARNSLAHAGKALPDKVRQLLSPDSSDEWNAANVAVRAISAFSAYLRKMECPPPVVPPIGCAPPAQLGYEIPGRVHTRQLEDEVITD